jgi:hypothetical protein
MKDLETSISNWITQHLRSSDLPEAAWIEILVTALNSDTEDALILGIVDSIANLYAGIFNELSYTPSQDFQRHLIIQHIVETQGLTITDTTRLKNLVLSRDWSEEERIFATLNQCVPLILRYQKSQCLTNIELNNSYSITVSESPFENESYDGTNLFCPEMSDDDKLRTVKPVLDILPRAISVD